MTGAQMSFNLYRTLKKKKVEVFAEFIEQWAAELDRGQAQACVIQKGLFCLEGLIKEL